MKMKTLDKYRVKTGAFGSNDGDGFGLFHIPSPESDWLLKVICAPMDEKWQHVSVSLPTRYPTWDEMCLIKSLFWDEEQTVIQFHPKKSQYVNNCGTCLHLWRKNGQDHELPPINLVGSL